MPLAIFHSYGQKINCVAAGKACKVGRCYTYTARVARAKGLDSDFTAIGVNPGHYRTRPLANKQRGVYIAKGEEVGSLIGRSNHRGIQNERYRDRAIGSEYRGRVNDKTIIHPGTIRDE